MINKAGCSEVCTFALLLCIAVLTLFSNGRVRRLGRIRDCWCGRGQVSVLQGCVGLVFRTRNAKYSSLHARPARGPVLAGVHCVHPHRYTTLPPSLSPLSRFPSLLPVYLPFSLHPVDIKQGLTMMPLLPISLELVVEITYPMREAMPSGLLVRSLPQLVYPVLTTMLALAHLFEP